MTQALRWIAKPWEGPTWILIIFLAVNRWFLSMQFGTATGNLGLDNGVSQFVFSMFKVLSVSLVISLCMSMMLRLVGKTERLELADLFEISLKAQSPYLLAVPLALAAMGLSAYLSAEQTTSFVKFLKGLLSFSMFCVLYAMLRKRLSGLGELKLITVLFSPYLFFLAALILGTLTLLAGAAAIVFHFAS